MSRKNKYISADDLAKKGEAKRKITKRLDKETKEKSSVSSLNYRRNADQKRIFTHITTWTDWKSVFLILTFFSASSLIPFFFLWMFMPEPSGFETSNLALLLGFCTVFWAIWIPFAQKQIKAKVLAEKKWIDDLPFKLIAYPDVLVYRSYPSIYFTIAFERKQPDLTYLLNILSTADYKVSSKVEYDEENLDSDDDIFSLSSIRSFRDFNEEEKEVTSLPQNAKNIIFKFEMTNDKGSKFNRHRRWARKWIIQTTEVQFQAIHNAYPIKSITLNDGTIELDFDWWISKRKWWKVF